MNPLHRLFRDLSLRRKLRAIITFTSALSLSLACAGFVLNDILTFKADTRTNTAAFATIVADHSAAALAFDDLPTATENLARLSTQPHILAAALYKNQVLFAQYVRPGAVAEVPATAPAAGWREGADRLELTRPVEVDHQLVGVFYLVRDLSDLRQRLQRYFAIAGALLFAATLAAFAFSTLVQRIVSQPLLQLADTARHVTVEKDYSVRASGDSRDEIGQVITGFNDMLTQIQQRDAALRAAQGVLEQRVAERTRELQQQISDRITAETALQQQLTRISLLNQIATALSNRQDLESILQIVLGQLEQHLPVDFGGVAIYEAKSDTLQVAGARWRTPPAVSMNQPVVPHGPLREALAGIEPCRAGNHVYVPQTAASTGPVPRRFASVGLASLVAVPLLVERRLFGLLVVARARPDAFTSGESEFLRMLGEQVAVAGSQAQLYSELQRAYTDLRQSQRTVMQQERLRALGQMASGIAHDINNSLSPIVTYADVLLAGNDNLPEKSRAYLRNIQTSAIDIVGIVARLRDFYRPRNLDEPHLPVDLRAILRQVAELSRPRWRDMPQARGIVISLATDFAPSLDLIEGNETELRESFINLVLNAVDAMPHGGSLTLRAGSRPGAAGGTEVFAEVIDTGVGMDEETRARCLEPFFSTKGQLGTGLGLAMVYGVIERHHGRIEIETKPAGGTTMRLVFSPLAPTGGSGRGQDTGARPRAMRILCVDDEPSLRTAVGDLLRLDGHEIGLAESGKAGLEAMRSAQADGRPFDVIITDLGMPHMDGQQFAATVKREQPQVRVILLTGWGKIMQSDGERPNDIDALLSKPPRLAELRQTLVRLQPSENPSR